MDILTPKRLDRLSFDNRANASIGQAVIRTLGIQSDTKDLAVAETRFVVWEALARGLSPEHWRLLAQTLRWLTPSDNAFVPAVPDFVRNFRVSAMPNRFIAAHVLVGGVIRAALDEPSAFLKGCNDCASLAQICFDWIDRVCTDEAIINIHVATGHVWRLDLLTPDGVDSSRYWPDFK